ncbi:MAG: hypothetical protein AABY64_12775 [Bdellovibrionota bacterium]
MKKIGDLMTEMGFRKEAPQSAKEAFLKHLIRAAEGVHVTTPLEKKEIEKNNIPQIPTFEAHQVQLSFDFNEVS